MIGAVHADSLLDPATGETVREAVVVIENGGSPMPVGGRPFTRQVMPARPGGGAIC